MELTKAGLNLFIAENAAQSLIGDVDVGGMMSSAFQRRHKIRSADVLQLLTECTNTPKNTYARLLGTAYLLTYASAAYAEVDQLLSADNLKNLQVTHHFGGVARSLELACVSEPMNLWFGWALENTRGNVTTFDPHMVSHMRSKKVKIQVSLPSSSKPNNVKTTNQQIFDSYSGGNAMLRGASTPVITKPELKRTLTPTSSGLEAMLANHNQYKQNIAGAKNIPALYGYEFCGDALLVDRVKLYIEYIGKNWHFPTNKSILESDLAKNKNSILTSLKNMRALVEDMNKRGVEHYNTLLEQLQVRFDEDDGDMLNSMSKTIKSAKKGWKINRAKLLDQLDWAIGNIQWQTSIPVYPTGGNYFEIDPKFYMAVAVS